MNRLERQDRLARQERKWLEFLTIQKSSREVRDIHKAKRMRYQEDISWIGH